MSGNEPVQLIVKKVKKSGGDAHHGGAWKVAYADFVTAMMAFFMLMWLLNATSDQQRKGIADYFSPKVPISELSGGGSGLFNGDVIFKSEQMISANRGGSDHTDDPSEDSETRPDRRDEQPAPETGDIAIDPTDAAKTALAAEMAPKEDVNLGETSETEPHESANAVAEIDTEEKKMAEDAAELSDAELAEAVEERRKQEVERIEAAFEELRAAEESSDLMKHLSMRLTPDGLMIEITETEGEPLFASGSSDPSAQMRALIEVVAPIIGELENRIAIVGHTDARAYRENSDYTNWELSADRGNSARRLLIEFGLPPERLARISGAADREPLSEDALAPENRRIGITLLREPPKRSPTTSQ